MRDGRHILGHAHLTFMGQNLKMADRNTSGQSELSSKMTDKKMSLYTLFSPKRFR
jgi:hypothetical protein